MKLDLPVSNIISIRQDEMPENLWHWIEKDLSIPYSTGPNWVLYEFADSNKPRVNVPRGYRHALSIRINQAGTAVNWINGTLLLPQVQFISDIVLNNDQARAVDTLCDLGLGGLIDECITRRIATMMAVVARLKQPVLWICNKPGEMTHIQGVAIEHLGLAPDESGIIDDKSITPGERFTIALTGVLDGHTMDSITRKFGCIVIDDIQGTTLDDFYRIAGHFPAKYRFWCSANAPSYEEGAPIIYSVGGKIVYKAETSN